MYSAAENLQLLKRELGDQARLLQYAPVDRVIAEALSSDEEPLAVFFKIYFGQIRERG